jgi:hypothetical protein
MRALWIVICVSLSACLLSKLGGSDDKIRCCLRNSGDPQCQCSDYAAGPAFCDSMETEVASCSTSDISMTPAICCDDPGSLCTCKVGSACSSPETQVAACPVGH